MFSDKNLAVQALAIQRDVSLLFFRLLQAIEQSDMSDSEKKETKDYIYRRSDDATTCISVVVLPQFPDLVPEDEGHPKDYWKR
jgi:hypothetical protein